MPQLPNISRNGATVKPSQNGHASNGHPRNCPESLIKAIARRLRQSAIRPLQDRAERLQDLFSRFQPVPEEWRRPPSKQPDPGNNLIYLISLTPPALGEAAYHGIIGDFLGEIAKYTEATDAGVLAHLLPAIGTLIGSGPYMLAGNHQPTRLNTVVVGPSNAGRKGTSSVPVNLLMSHIDDVFWREQCVGGLQSGEGLIDKVSDHKEWNKETKCYDIQRVEKRLFVQEPEFARILIQSRKEGSILSHILRESFDSGKLGTLTKNRPLQVNDAHICICGHITPEELVDRFSAVEMANGFGNRFLWFAVRSDKLIPFSEPIPDTCIEKFAVQFKKSIQFASGQERMEMDEGAREFWADLYPSLREDQPGFAGATTSRGACIVQRIALIYALVDRSTEVCRQHVEAALAVWTYNVESAKELFKGKSGDKLADKIYQLLIPGPMKTTELHHHFNANAAEINHALETLERNERIRKVIITHKGAGRPATLWEVVPPV